MCLDTCRRSGSIVAGTLDDIGVECYAGLETFESRVAHKLNYKDEAIQQRVIELRQQNPDWGKARISQEMAKANNWVPLVSPNTVKGILQKANLWPERGSGEKRN